VTVTVSEDGGIRLHGVCPIDDAESLLRCLLASGEATVDWRGCVQAHSAVIQILLATRPALLGPPADGFLRTHIAPLVDGSAAMLPPLTS
jgi:hypothetical protein